MKPTRRAIYLLLLLCVVAVVTQSYPIVWTVSGVVFVGLLAADFVWLRDKGNWHIERSMDVNLAVGTPNNVTLSITNLNQDRLGIDIFDHIPDSFEQLGLPQSCELQNNETATITYSIRPRLRGDRNFKYTELRIGSLLGFWRKTQLIAVETKTKIYPNFRSAAHFALLAVDNKLGQMGVKVVQQRGEGLDFHQLREFRAGDTFRQVDWKATVRRNKLISREFKDERDQQIVFLLDCGRRMRHLEGRSELLDQAINAMLVLTHIAAKQGDAIGFLTTGGVNRWVKPLKGRQTMNHILEQCYDIHSTNNPSDYLVAATELLKRQKRRSLIVILTNTRTEEQDELSRAISILRKKHLVVLADLQEEVLEQGLRGNIESLEDAHLFHGTLAYLTERRRSHEQLKHAGAICFDTQAKYLAPKLVSEYLSLKHSTML